MNRAIFWAGSLALALWTAPLADPARAQSDLPWPEGLANPIPLADDLTLPMPCGGSMAFRPITVPGGGIFDDRRIQLGGRQDGREYIENPHPTYIGGSFLGEGVSTYYLGKYEVSVAQYQALLAGETGSGDSGANCPDLTADDALLPQTRITMADAQRAAEAYTGWLASHAVYALPQEGDALAYIRLPTEEEWEYAARGGAAVEAADFEARLPPMPDGPEQYEVFCRDDCAEPQLTGSLKANPLGLHDMLGNVSELVQGSFRLNRVARDHGTAGAWIKRGGSFRHRLEEIHSGLREEFSPLARDNLRREAVTGLRLVLVAPVLPDLQRAEAARDQWAALSAETGDALDDQQADPRAELRTLAAYAATLETSEAKEVRRRLLNLADVVDITIATRNEQRARAAREMLRMAVFVGLRLPAHQGSVTRCAELLALNAERYQARCDRVSADRDYDVDYFIDHLTRLAGEFPRGFVEEQAEILSKEFEARGQGTERAVPVVLANLQQITQKGERARAEITEVWGRYSTGE